MSETISCSGPVQELWNGIMARALEIWSPPDFHFLELTSSQFEELLPRLDATVADFSRAAYEFASGRNRQAVLELHRGFVQWVGLCDISKTFCGKVHRGNYDLFKFVGHEMFVTLIAALVRHEFWEGLKAILPLDWGLRYQQPIRYSTIFSQYSSLFEDRESRISELLSQRHGEGGPLASPCSLADFQAADLLLLWHHCSQPKADRQAWHPWSLGAARQAPAFLSQEQQLIALFGLGSPEELRQALEQSMEAIRTMFPGPDGQGPAFLKQINPGQG